MRFLIALVAIIVLTQAERGEHLAKPHVPGYQNAKKAFGRLERSLDSLSYVLATKGVRATPVCGLAVPSFGPYVKFPVDANLPAPVVVPHVKKNTYTPPVPVAVPVPVVVAAAVPVVAVGKKEPDAPVVEDAKIAVVKYENKKALDDALAVARAEIVADDALVSAKAAKIQYLQLKEKLDGAKAAQALKSEVQKDKSEIAKIKAAEEKVKEAEEKLQVLNVANKREKGTGSYFRAQQTPVGVVLADQTSRTVYTLDSEAKYGGVKCTGECETFFSPVPSGQVGAGFGGDFGTVVRPDGSVQATFNGKPLYRFRSDHGPGTANGDNTNGFRAVRPGQ